MSYPVRFVKRLSLVVFFALLAAACTTPTTPPPAAKPPTTGATPSPLATPPGGYPLPNPMTPYPEAPVTQPAYPQPSQPGSKAAVVNPFAPQPGDAALSKGNAFVDQAQVASLGAKPPQAALHLSGNLPTPCNQLRVQIDPPDAQKDVQVQVYSVIDSTTACIQMLAPFEASVPLSFSAAGKYTLYVNGQSAGSVSVP